MKSITWQFSTGDSAISKAIRWKTDSEISHVDAVTPEGKLLGAHINDGVLVREPDYMAFELRIRVTVPVTVFCSELQAQGIKDAGIIWIAKDSSKIDPETLRLLVTAIPGATEKRIEG